ncbi:MAG: hypothetical protein PHO67_08220 [Candidatus Omnitrophica bacterium]|nr:hypothetical protein [Candidatus Omnitrophota bacterium]
MNDLKQEIEILRDAFREDRFEDIGCGEVADMLDSILSKCVPNVDDWRGPWRCEKCSKVWYTKVSAHYWNWNSHPSLQELCDGTLVPYERRGK